MNTISTRSLTVWSPLFGAQQRGRFRVPKPQLILACAAPGSSAAGWLGSKRTLLITPTTAQVLAEGGYASKDSLKTDLAKTARVVTHEWAFSKVHGSFGTIYPPFEEELAKTMAEPRAEKGKLPPWWPRFPGWEEIKTTPSVARPSDLDILVLGDPSRNKVQILSAGGYNTIQIRLPGNWDELMKTAGYRPLSDYLLAAPKN